MRRRIHACHMRRRIHACHMRRRIHDFGGYLSYLSLSSARTAAEQGMILQ
jgi:hypothetical protein